MICLPDVNVWIALTSDRHIHHPIAKNWLNADGNRALVFCRITELGFLRLLTNRHVMGDEVLSPPDAWETYRRLSSDFRVSFLAEPDGFADNWSRVAGKLVPGPNAWTDAYLAAFASSANLTIATFDKSFRAVNGCQVEVLQF
jgi:toxin-antitoxin system PIN domain toxin